MSKKSLSKILNVVIVVFILLNAIWFSVTKTKYNTYQKRLEEVAIANNATEKEFRNDSSKHKFYRKDEITYAVHYPGYLSFTGNLSMVCSSDEGEYKFQLMIWPKYFGETEYTITLDNGHNAESGIMIDKDGNVLKDYYKEEYEYEEAKQIVENNRAEVDFVLQKVNEMWP